jgi:hypothetical protein
VTLAPIVGRRRDDDADDKTKYISGFRAAYVFGILSRDSATGHCHPAVVAEGATFYGRNFRSRTTTRFELDCRVCSDVDQF